MFNKIAIAILFSYLFAFYGCKKSPPAVATTVCDEIKQVKIAGVNSLYFPGDEVDIKAGTAVDGTYTWRFGNNTVATGITFSIASCTKFDDGWYYLTVTSPDCDPYTDSAYVRVYNKPLTPTCNPLDNQVTFTGIPDISFNTTSFAVDVASGCRVLSASQAPGSPEVKIYLNPYWTTHPFEDGEYSTASALSFPGHELYSVYVGVTYAGSNFSSMATGSVYLWHDEGRIRATICKITMVKTAGSGSPSTITALGELTGQ